MPILQSAHQRMSSGADYGAARVRAGLDSVRAAGADAAHRLRKDAEYVSRRTVHNAEKLGHRIEEKTDEIRDKARYKMPN